MRDGTAKVLLASYKKLESWNDFDLLI